MNTKLKKVLRIILTILVTIGIFLFLFSKISLGGVIETLKGANIKIVILALFISIISNTLIVSYRWKLILWELKHHISFRETLFIKMGSRIFPLKTNEVSRILYLKRLKEIPYATAIFSVASEYLLSALALLFFIFLSGVIFCGKRIVSYSTPLLIGAFNIGGIFEKKFWNKYIKLFKEYLSKFRKLLKNKYIIFISILYWALDLLNVYLLSIALGNPLPVSKILLFMPIVIFAGGLPIAFGGLGTREITLIFLFSSHGSMEMLLSLSLLYYFTEQLFPNLVSIGFSGMFLDRMIWKKWK